MKRTKTTRLTLCFAALAFAALLAGCRHTNNAGADAPQRAFCADYLQELPVEGAEHIVCTPSDTWIVTTIRNDFLYRIDHTAEVEKTEKIEWQQEDNEILLSLAERGGAVYISVLSAERDRIEIRRRYPGGAFQALMQVENSDDGWQTVGGGLFVGQDGSVYLAGRSSVTRFTKEGARDREYKIGAGGGFFTEDGGNGSPAPEYVAADADGISLYDLSGETAEKKWTLPVSATRIYSVRCSAGDTLCISTNDKLLFVDRDSGSLLSQSELVLLGMVSVRAGFYHTEEETLRLCGKSGGSLSTLSLGSFRRQEGNAGKRTELVYGTAGAQPHDTTIRIKNAITEFNRTNKDYYVTVKVYQSEYSSCTGLIQADMAAGSAPDIIEITGISATWSEYESYVRNGYLEDLSPWLEQSAYKDDLNRNALNAFELDGGLYVLPPQFMLSAILIHPDYEHLVENWNMDAFYELLEKNQWEKNIFSAAGSAPDHLLYRLMFGANEKFVNWEQKTASFDSEAFIRLLTLCKEYGEQPFPGVDTAGWGENERYQNTLCNPIVISMYSEYLHYADVYGREFPLYGSPAASGQVYEIMPSSDSCGIYAGSRHKEGAWEFLESLLSEPQQKWMGGDNWGFPIRNSMLKEVADAEKEKNITTPDHNILQLSDKDIALFDEILYHERLVREGINSTIWQIIQEEASFYFSGDKSAEEAAHIIQSRVEIVLNE